MRWTACLELSFSQIIFWYLLLGKRRNLLVFTRWHRNWWWRILWRFRWPSHHLSIKFAKIHTWIYKRYISRIIILKLLITFYIGYGQYFNRKFKYFIECFYSLIFTVKQKDTTNAWITSRYILVNTFVCFYFCFTLCVFLK